MLVQIKRRDIRTAVGRAMIDVLLANGFAVALQRKGADRMRAGQWKSLDRAQNELAGRAMKMPLPTEWPILDKPGRQEPVRVSSNVGGRLVKRVK